MPSVQRVHEAFENKDVVVLTISIDAEGVQAVKPFLTEHGYTMPALLDSSMEVAHRYGVRATPTTHVVDRRGMIVASGFGPVDFDSPEFRKYIQTLVDQRPT